MSRTPIRGPIRGRGAAEDLPNRFARAWQAAPEDEDNLGGESWGDPWEEPVPPSTELLEDASRTILSSNQSPDIPFRFSLNPYRGCEHGCSYCLDGSTRVLMADGASEALADLRIGDAIYGTAQSGGARRAVPTRVLDLWQTKKPALRVELEDGTELIASGDHRFLTERGWKFVQGDPRGRGQRPLLRLGDSLVGFGSSPEQGGRLLESKASLRVVSIEPLPGERALYDMTTGTGDFFANGVVSHNCYARPGHEYLGYSPGLEFETKIVYKPDAARLLARELDAKRWQPQVIALSGVTDCYQPIERELGLTRACLEVLAERRNPASVITKSYGVTRDKDLLAELARHGAASALLSINSLDATLSGRLEPRASRPARRLRAIRELAEAGVPVGVMVAPVIPGLNDHELPAVLEAAKEAGASFAGWILLRLPLAVEPLFLAWLERHYPQRASKVLARLRDLRGGELSDARFGRRMRGQGPLAQQLSQLFQVSRRRHGLDGGGPELSASAFRRPRGPQLELFEL